jgi:hypothetical protein
MTIPALAAALIKNLTQYMAEPDGTSAFEILHYLARLEAFPREKLEAAGVNNLVEHTQGLRVSDPTITQLASVALAPTALYQAGNEIRNGERERAAGWAEDVLAVCAVYPWLHKEVQDDVYTIVRGCGGLVATYPQAFKPASSLVLTRLTEETVSGLADEFVRAVATKSWTHGSIN